MDYQDNSPKANRALGTLLEQTPAMKIQNTALTTN